MVLFFSLLKEDLVYISLFDFSFTMPMLLMDPDCKCLGTKRAVFNYRFINTTFGSIKGFYYFVLPCSDVFDPITCLV